MPRFAFAGALGAALAYFFDPDNGRKRRKEAIKRAAKRFRQAGRKAQGVTAHAQGLKERATHLSEQEKSQPDDVTQARKVQGVRAVENLLHVPGEEAPAKAE